MNPILQLLNVIPISLVLLFYPYLNIKTIIFFASLLLLLNILPYQIKILKYFKDISFYIQILILFIPIALSLNFSRLTLTHWIIFFLLVVSAIISIFTGKDLRLLIGEKIYFAILSVIFLTIIISFIYFAPIKDEYQTKIEYSSVLLKSLYLLLLFFLIYFNQSLLEEMSHLNPQGILRPQRIITGFLILIIIFSLYDVINLRNSAERCIKNDYYRCESSIKEISDRLKIKGLNRQSITFLKSYIGFLLTKNNADAIGILDYAIKLYPYECNFFIMKMEYYKRSGMNDKLKELLLNPPAPIKKGCKEIFSGESDGK
ncbi:MAG: hypothetical protein ACP5QK_05540 [Myxococcota bacterium]